MAIALIRTTPTPSILKVYDRLPSRIDVPGQGEIHSPPTDWSAGAYRLVPVVAFAVPAGREPVGDPAYEIDGRGVVTETRATKARDPERLATHLIVVALDALGVFDLAWGALGLAEQVKFLTAPQIPENDPALTAMLSAAGKSLPELKAQMAK